MHDQVKENLFNAPLYGFNETDRVPPVTDHDGDVITYAISGSEKFEINSTTGNIKLVDGITLNYEQESSYQITVIVSDSDGLSDSMSFSVEVIDMNDAPGNDANVRIGFRIGFIIQFGIYLYKMIISFPQSSQPPPPFLSRKIFPSQLI